VPLRRLYRKREADETEITPEIPRWLRLNMLTGAAAARMALDQPGVGVSSAHDKSIACVTRVRGLRLLSASRWGARP